MQLRNARLCLDCEEVHDAQHCPVCASESFAFITRWVPAPERRAAPRPAAPTPAHPAPDATAPESSTPETLTSYRQLLTPEKGQGAPWSLVKRGALGLALFGVAGLVWRQKGRAPESHPESAPTDEETP